MKIEKIIKNQNYIKSIIAIAKKEKEKMKAYSIPEIDYKGNTYYIDFNLKEIRYLEYIEKYNYHTVMKFIPFNTITAQLILEQYYTATDNYTK